MINAADTVLLEPDLEPGARAQSRPKTCRLRNKGGNVKFSAAVSSFSRYTLNRFGNNLYLCSFLHSYFQRKEP